MILSDVVLKLCYEQFGILEVASSSSKTGVSNPDVLREAKLCEYWMGCRCCWKGILAFEEGVGQGCSVPAPNQVLVRDQVWISRVLFQGWRVYGRNKKPSQEESEEKRNYFSKFVLRCQGQHWALTWFCHELNQSKFTNVGFLRCGFCCCSFPDSRFLRLILSEFHCYIFGNSAA